MYWIYLLLFIGIIFTPEAISGKLWFLDEEVAESTVIFVFGLIGLLLYLGKESALLRTLREKLSLQQESNKIRKDLAQSYSYIGEMNRQLEIVKTMLVESPHTLEMLASQHQGTIYDPVFEAALLLAQSDGAALYFVRERDETMLKQFLVGTGKEQFLALTGPLLLAVKKYWWQDNGLLLVRSSESSRGVTAILAVRSIKNRVEETGVFQILVTHALLLFSLHAASHAAEETRATRDTLL